MNRTFIIQLCDSTGAFLRRKPHRNRFVPNSWIFSSIKKKQDRLTNDGIHALLFNHHQSIQNQSHFIHSKKKEKQTVKKNSKQEKCENLRRRTNVNTIRYRIISTKTKIDFVIIVSMHLVDWLIIKQISLSFFFVVFHFFPFYFKLTLVSG